MNYLISPTSFKGSLSALEAARIMAEGIIARDPSSVVTLCPIADGGEGTLDVFQARSDFSLKRTDARDPLRTHAKVSYGTIHGGEVAVIESARCIGLPLVAPENRHPLLTSSHGLGDVILHALRAGCSHLIIGLGGSAVNDCGLGMLEVLDIVESHTGEWNTATALRNCASIRMNRITELFTGVTLTVLADVRNPLIGIEGATHVYGRQKGASDAVVAELESAITAFSDMAGTFIRTSDSHAKGSGSAGGMGYALSLCGGSIVSGAAFLLDLADFDAKCRQADVVITGEGRLDVQTRYGKAVHEVIKRAKRFEIPVVAFAGQVVGELDSVAKDYGLDGIVEIATGTSEADAMKRASALLRDAAFNYGMFLAESVSSG